MNVMHLLKTLIAFTFVASFVIGALFMIRSTDDNETRVRSVITREQLKTALREEEETEQTAGRVLPRPHERHPDLLVPLQTSTPKPNEVNRLKDSVRTPSVHIFYYPWYGNPEFDHGRYYHWDHPLLLKSKPKKGFEQTRHQPPEDIASVSYPQLGPYSSRDPAVIERHFKWMSSAGVDVVAISWYPKGKADDQGYPWEDLTPTLLNASLAHQLQVVFHLEPYAGRTALSVRDDIAYVVRTYGRHAAFHRAPTKSADRSLPLFYVYDSYRVDATDWQQVALPGGAHSIRGTDFDAILVGLALKITDVDTIKAAGFDGVYTYFAADGFTEAASMNNWAKLSTVCAEKQVLFIPSVGPGYNDSRVRPWNTVNTRSRNKGDYYVKHFEAAHAAKPDMLSITSFNEWHEGTQVEPAIPFADHNTTQFEYLAYDEGPEMYLQLTNEMVRKYFVPHHENIPMNIAKIV